MYKHESRSSPVRLIALLENLSHLSPDFFHTSFMDSGFCPMNDTKNSYQISNRLSVSTLDTLTYLFIKRFHIWITFFNLTRMFEYGFCLLNDYHDDCQLDWLSHFHCRALCRALCWCLAILVVGCVHLVRKQFIA